MGGYWRSVMTVLTGTAMAQAFPLALTPVLTRLYSPEELGDYSIWFGAVSVLLILGSARLEMALFVSKDESDRENLARLVLVFASAVSALSAPAALMLCSLTSLSPLVAVFALPLALTVFSLSVYQFLLSCLVYSKEFARLGWARFSLAASTVVAQVVAGSMGAGVAGLVYCHLCGAILALLTTLLWSGMKPGRLLSGAIPREMLSCLRRHWKFPVASIPADVVSALTTQLPLFMLAARFDSASAGYFSIATRVLGAPVGLLASSVLDVYTESSAREFRETGSCRRVFLRTLKALTLGAVVPFLLIGLFGAPVFGAVFGTEWEMAGRIAMIMSPLFFLRFIFSPLSYTIYVAGKQQYDLLWQFVLFCLVVASFRMPPGLDACLWMYVASYSAMYLIYGAMCYRFALGGRHDSGR